MSFVQQDEPLAVREPRSRDPMRELSRDSASTRRAGRSVGRCVVRCDRSERVCSGCRRLLGAVVRAVPHDGTGTREGRTEHGWPRARDQSQHRRPPRVGGTFPHPVHSDAGSLSRREGGLALFRCETGSRYRSARCARLAKVISWDGNILDRKAPWQVSVFLPEESPPVVWGFLGQHSMVPFLLTAGCECQAGSSHVPGWASRRRSSC